MDTMAKEWKRLERALGKDAKRYPRCGTAVARRHHRASAEHLLQLFARCGGRDRLALVRRGRGSLAEVVDPDVDDLSESDGAEAHP